MTHEPSAGPAAIPRRLEVRRDCVVLGGVALDDVTLSGWAYGPPLGEAPVVMVVGGITATPLPFGDGVAREEGGHGEGWWPALRAADLIDPARVTVLCPAWPGNGSGLGRLTTVTGAGGSTFMTAGAASS